MRICDRLKGSPDLAIEILKKIGSSTVFVGDATPVGRGAPHKTDEGVESPGEALMNPNAAIELGYALKSQVDRERPSDHDTRIWVAPSSTV